MAFKGRVRIYVAALQAVAIAFHLDASQPVLGLCYKSAVGVNPPDVIYKRNSSIHVQARDFKPVYVRPLSANRCCFFVINITRIQRRVVLS